MLVSLIKVIRYLSQKFAFELLAAVERSNGNRRWTRIAVIVNTTIIQFQGNRI